MIHLGKFEGVLLASDFDDTLVGSDCEVSRGNREALEYFVREGGRFTVSTGRAHRTFAPYVDAAPINAPVILSNGALLYDFRAGRTVVDLPLPVCAAEDLGELCSAIPALGVETYHGDDVYIYRPNAHTQRHVERVKTTWTEMGLAEMPSPCSKAVIQADHDVLLRAQALHRPDHRHIGPALLSPEPARPARHSDGAPASFCLARIGHRVWVTDS